MKQGEGQGKLTERDPIVKMNQEQNHRRKCLGWTDADEQWQSAQQERRKHPISLHPFPSVPVVIALTYSP